MDWITGMQNAIDYIEEHITEKVDYDEIARCSCLSSYNFQRVFGILCGYTLGEYIRNRRLSMAGQDFAQTGMKVIDVALKYGYESPDSFAKAFQKFHGVTPSAAREAGAVLRSFARLSVKISLEGGSVMNYRIEEKAEMILTGYTTHFTGSPSDRYNQQHDFMVKGETRFIRYALQGMAKDCTVEYSVISSINDEGYDFTIGTVIPQYFNEHLEETVGKENAERLNVIRVPARKYLVVETERSVFAMDEHLKMRKQAVPEWIESSDYQLADAPEIAVSHANSNDKDNSFVELWLPIEKKI